MIKVYLYRKRKRLKRLAWRYFKNFFLFFSINVEKLRMGTGGFDYDIQRLMPKVKDHPLVLFDIGANRGQTAIAYASLYKEALIYSFEPDPDTFLELKENVMGIGDRVKLFNLALGDNESQQFLNRTASSDGSSLLPVSDVAKERPAEQWTSQTDRILVNVTVLNNFCLANNVSQIDLLKIDTQGYELNILKGADKMLAAGQVKFILVEALFQDFYQSQADFQALYAFIRSHGFELVDIYNRGYLKDKHRIAWADLLFIHQSVVS
jgi:FkbM family methyltransferase